MRCTSIILFTAFVLGRAENEKLARRLGFDVKESRKLATCKCRNPAEGNMWPRNHIECSNGEEFACNTQQECWTNDPFKMPLDDNLEVTKWLPMTDQKEWYNKCPTTDWHDIQECMDGTTCHVKQDPKGENCCHERGGLRRCPKGTTQCRLPEVEAEAYIRLRHEVITRWFCAGPGMELANCDAKMGHKSGSDCQNYVCPFTSDTFRYECNDGSTWDIFTHKWEKCQDEGRGGRKRCPKNYVMCEKKDATGDYACEKSLKECDWKPRRDCSSYEDEGNVNGPLDDKVCRYFVQEGNSFNKVMMDKGFNPFDIRDKLDDSKAVLEELNMKPICPTREEILGTPLVGKSGDDRKARWDCPTCDCGCHIPFGASYDDDKPDWVPPCTQSKGNWRFPYPHLVGGMQTPPMIEQLSNFANDAGQEEFDWTAPKDTFVSGFWTKREAHYHDRVFKFHYKSFSSYLPKSASHGDEYTTAWCNTKDSGNSPQGQGAEGMDCRCRAGYAVVGFESKHDKGTKDRQWKLKCAKLAGTRVLNTLPKNFRATGAVNAFGDDGANWQKVWGSEFTTGNKLCQHDEAVCGLYGHHLDHPHDDRSYGIYCCRVQIAAQQCSVVQIEITSQVVAAMNDHASKTHADKISVNNCGNPLGVKNTLSNSHVVETQTSSTYELSKSMEETFTIGVSAEISMGFEYTSETPGNKLVGGVEKKFSMGMSIGTNVEKSRTTSKSSTSVQFSQVTNTESFQQGFEYEAPANTKLIVTSTAKEYEGSIFWTGIAKCMYDAGGQLVTLESKPVSGSWTGAKVRQGDVTFDVKTCASDGFKMEYERYCDVDDRLTDELTGEWLTYDTMSEAKEACEKNPQCGAIFDEGCTNDGSEQIMLCKEGSFLEFSPLSCVLVKTAIPRGEAPTCPVGYDGPCSETKACPAQLNDCGSAACCSIGWKVDCDMHCARDRCHEANGNWIEGGDRGLNRNVHHYVCEVPPKQARKECHCKHPGSSQEIICNDGHETTCAADEYCSNSMAIHRDTVHFETVDCIEDEETARCRAKKHICAPMESDAAKALRGAF